MEGIVVTGKGDSSAGSDRLWDLYREISGMKLVPGTLNVQVREPCDLPDIASRLSAGKRGGPCDVILAKCRVAGHPGSSLEPLTMKLEEGQCRKPSLS